MANIHDKVSEQGQPTGGGMRRVLADGSESLSELRDFMGRLRGKSPQEVLGEVATSSLVRSTLVSAVGFGVVLIVLSVATFHWKQAFPGKTPVAANPAAAPAPAPDADKSATGDGGQANATEPGAGTGATADPGAASGDPTLDTLGIGETKQAEAGKNPLENSLDNLLDNAK